MKIVSTRYIYIYIYIYIVKYDFCNFVFRKKLPTMIAMAIAATIIEP